MAPLLPKADIYRECQACLKSAKIGSSAYRQNDGESVPKTAGGGQWSRGVEFRKWPTRPYVPTGIKNKPIKK
jgi:hypothetical protein